MLSVTSSRVINTSPTRVYDAFISFGDWGKWVRHFRDVTPLTEGSVALGVKARIVLRFIPMASVWEVTEIAPGCSFAWAYSLPGLRFVFHHIAEGVEGGTRVTLRIDFHGPLAFLPWLAGIVPKTTSHFALNALEHMLERDASVVVTESHSGLAEGPKGIAKPVSKSGFEVE